MTHETAASRRVRSVALPLHGSMAGVALALAVWGTAAAKTIVLDAGTAADRMAGICDVAPRQSWATFEQWSATFYSNAVQVQPGRGFLIRFRLDAIPPGQQITHAELIVPVTTYSSTDVRFYLWRVLADWDAGVCHLYRVAIPKKIPWTRPGARGGSSDRATRPTAIVRLTEGPGEQVINVTEDVDLWYSGAAPNNGWLLSVEDPATSVRFQCPTWDGGQSWRLRITYEPQ